ncbi:CAV3 [Lepeophtheirus salmonis]|nr:CAV3 [Lepeophtheirus salmonis]CAF2808839.1 CAV3 [Lepeophtheirus salmonis]
MGDEHMMDRDPGKLNEHLQVMWDDIIGEPEGLRTIDCAWKCSHTCFRGTRNCCYIVLTTLFAPIFAFCSAINLACLAFQHIWCYGPCLRTWKINCAFVRAWNLVCMTAVCGPCVEIFGMYFSKLKVRYQRLPDAESDEEKNIMNI